MIAIPNEYLERMGAYSTKIGGDEVKVKVVDIVCASLIATHINEMRSALETWPVRVVGVDNKRFIDRSRELVDSARECFVLCVGANCLIVHLPPPQTRIKPGQPGPSKNEAPEELMKFLQDRSISFVGSTWRPTVLEAARSWGVEAGTLAAMVLKKPSLIQSPLSIISQEVGIPYEAPTNIKAYESDCLEPHFILTEEQVHFPVADAYTYYKIGHKLLQSLKPIPPKLIVTSS